MRFRPAQNCQLNTLRWLLIAWCLRYILQESSAQECISGQSKECSAATSLALEDKNADCPFFAEEGECDMNPPYMLENCIRSCLDRGELGTLGGFGEEIIPYDKPDGGACEDTWDKIDPDEREDYRSCEELVEHGHCWMMPALMMERCPLSCLYCFEKE